MSGYGWLSTRRVLGEGIGFLDEPGKRINALLGPENNWERDGRGYWAVDVGACSPGTAGPQPSQLTYSTP